MFLIQSPQNDCRRVPLMALPSLLATAAEVAPVEPSSHLPERVCEETQSDPRQAMGLTVAYGIMLIERLHRGELSREEFRQAVRRVRSITQLIGEQEIDAAFVLLREIEERYGLERPELDLDDRFIALYRSKRRADR